MTTHQPYVTRDEQTLDLALERARAAFMADAVRLMADRAVRECQLCGYLDEREGTHTAERWTLALSEHDTVRLDIEHSGIVLTATQCGAVTHQHTIRITGRDTPQHLAATHWRRVAGEIARIVTGCDHAWPGAGDCSGPTAPFDGAPVCEAHRRACQALTTA